MGATSVCIIFVSRVSSFNYFSFPFPVEREGLVGDLEVVIPGDRFGRTGRRRVEVKDLRGEKVGD
jgi:hypothetical protein